MGYVLNDTSGVTIEIEGERAPIDEFMDKVRSEPPTQAVIFEMQNHEIEHVGYDDFIIRKSEDQQEKFVPISPEIATCKDCINELFDSNNFRYRYPFIN